MKRRTEVGKGERGGKGEREGGKGEGEGGRQREKRW